MSKKNKIAVLIIAAVIAISAAALIFKDILSSGGGIATVYKNGEVIREIDLANLEEPIEFDITDADGHINTVRAEKGRIRVLKADCPDKICVNRGWIDSDTVPIVCLPNKVTIEISGNDGGIDGRTGGF